MATIINVKDGPSYIVTYDNANIATVPKANGNADYANVLQWLLDGGTLDPADDPLDPPSPPPSPPSVTTTPIWQTGTVTTTTTAKQNVMTYTIPDGYDFYLTDLAVTRNAGSGIMALPTTLEVWNTTPTMTLNMIENIRNTPDTWSQHFSPAQRIATAGNVIRITVTPNGTLSTTWSCRLIGQLISI